MNDFSKSAKVLVVVFLFAGCLSVHLPKIQIRYNEETKNLTWKSLVATTVANNPDLQKSRDQITSSTRSRDIAFGDYLPSVDGELARSHSRNSGGGFSSSTSGGGGGRDNLSLDLVGNQSLFNGFETTGNFLQAKRNLEAAVLSYSETSAGVRFRLRSAYIDLLRLERLQEVSQRIAKRRLQNAELVKLRYEAGRENLGASMRAEAIAKQAEYAVRQTSRRMQSQALRIARESGSEFVIPVHVDDNMEKILPKPANVMPDYVATAEKAPNVQRLLKVAESAKAAVLTAQSAVWPDINGSFDYGYSGSRASQLKYDSFIGITASVPFFNGGKNIEGILKAKADYDAANQAAVSSRAEAVAALATAWVNFVDSVEFVEVRRKFLEASRKRAEIIREQYATGLTGFQEFDIAEQENADSEASYVESLANVFVQQATWDQVRGLTLEDALNEI